MLRQLAALFTSAIVAFTPSISKADHEITLDEFINNEAVSLCNIVHNGGSAAVWMNEVVTVIQETSIDGHEFNQKVGLLAKVVYTSANDVCPAYANPIFNSIPTLKKAYTNASNSFE